MVNERYVLCFRKKPENIPPNIKANLQKVYGNVVFRYINPETPETMLELAHEKEVAVVYMPEKHPITLVIKEQKIACVTHAPDGTLARIKNIKIELEPLIEPIKP